MVDVPAITTAVGLDAAETALPPGSDEFEAVTRTMMVSPTSPLTSA
jgi:hypothetical protein